VATVMWKAARSARLPPWHGGWSRSIARLELGRTFHCCPVRHCVLSGNATGTNGSVQFYRALATSAAQPDGSTQLGTYLRRCGAVWDAAPKVNSVMPAACGHSFTWRIDLPPARLQGLRRGDPCESPPFTLADGSRARLQFFPKGDRDCTADGMCSLWLWCESSSKRKIRLRAGSGDAHDSGASNFAPLHSILQDDAVEVSLEFADEDTVPLPAVEPVMVQQSLQLTGLQLARWQVFNVGALMKAGQLVSSPPFRFHHVLLGDMYLELLPDIPYPGHCSIFFRCRVPTMQLRVGISVGDAFSKTFVALGCHTPEVDIKNGACLGVNLDAPNVLGSDGSLTISCFLESVVQIPRALEAMIPKLDERALWPKRL